MPLTSIGIFRIFARVKKKQNLEKENPIKEAQRYVENAKQTLEENGKLDNATRLYGDRKYVRAAGHYLWNAVLIVLDAVFQVKTKQRPHPDIRDYKDAVARRDRKLLSLVNYGYDTMHISMGYDGYLQKDICDYGISLANNIISHCTKMLPKQTNN